MKDEREKIDWSRPELYEVDDGLGHWEPVTRFGDRSVSPIGASHKVFSQRNNTEWNVVDDYGRIFNGHKVLRLLQSAATIQHRTRRLAADISLHAPDIAVLLLDGRNADACEWLARMTQEASAIQDGDLPLERPDCPEFDEAMEGWH